MCDSGRETVDSPFFSFFSPGQWTRGPTGKGDLASPFDQLIKLAFYEDKKKDQDPRLVYTSAPLGLPYLRVKPNCPGTTIWYFVTLHLVFWKLKCKKTKKDFRLEIWFDMKEFRDVIFESAATNTLTWIYSNDIFVKTLCGSRSWPYLSHFLFPVVHRILRVARS